MSVTSSTSTGTGTGTTTTSAILAEPVQHPRRYLCLFDGCDKSFLRKEHLGRHERTHNPQTLCICKVCHRKFNRSDSLLRHLSRHGDAFRPNPSGRSKRACISCHTGKTKCDGTHPCSTCLKKEIDCIYRKDISEPNDVQQKSSSPGTSDPMSLIEESSTSATPASSTTSQEPSHISTPSHTSPLARDPLVSATSHLSLHGRELDTALITMPPPRFGYIDWMTVRIQSDPQPHPGSNCKTGVDTPERRYLKLFFENFHHRWGLIHRPSFAEEGNETPLIAAMRMIGAWLSGSPESREHAVNVHERLLENNITRLSRVNTHDPLCLGLCETSLLNIVFGIYYGKDKIISRVVILRNILIAALREVEFFKSETAWADEKPEYFLPMRQVKQGQRQRLAAHLWKADTYLSLIRCQPKVMMPEELYFTLPSTYSLWNADGLYVWEERQSREPTFRSETSMFDMITDSLSDSSKSSSNIPMLIEDVQVCMCALQSSMWRFFQPATTPKDCEFDVILQKDTLRRRLDALRSRLDQMATQNKGDCEFGEEPYMPLRQYYGYEDHSLSNWKEIVSARVKSLHFDAMMLSYLLGLHLHADIGMLNILAKCQTLSMLQELSERHCRAREQRQISARCWANTSTARQALCGAVDILVHHQTITREQVSGLDKNTMEPIAHIAVSVAALVVWAYCTYGTFSCESCTPELSPGTLFDGVHSIELTAWSSNHRDHQQQSIKDLWIEIGGGTRVQLQGMQICTCNIPFLIAPFQACLPQGWDLANQIAPDIFKQ